MVKRYVMVFKYLLRGYMLRISCYEVRSTKYVIRDTKYVLCVIWYTLHLIWERSTFHVGTCHVVHGIYYTLRLTWLSLYDSPPLAVFKGLFSFRKWFCFLELKIKNDWWFHFWNSNFSGKGNRGSI